ncbi:hypothetical protein BG261_02955 [Floricoccus tropicus]|uniref:Uncharacterized protein n=1 Tax=Floricoccus tropicus TaxID=1859473 RepID=A0A1E8GMS9_9LACT|nr:hypothetical protein [Floricoccus tropicus]OFI49554.1 hypothetical protein BG261_02955 [Floricoccus tropicus]
MILEKLIVKYEGKEYKDVLIHVEAKRVSLYEKNEFVKAVDLNKVEIFIKRGHEVPAVVGLWIMFSKGKDYSLSEAMDEKTKAPSGRARYIQEKAMTWLKDEKRYKDREEKFAYAWANGVYLEYTQVQSSELIQYIETVPKNLKISLEGVSMGIEE